MLGDTIFAVASPPGAGARGILRTSGPAALEATNRLWREPVPCSRGVFERELQVLGYPVEAVVLVMPAPASYTGEDVVELHLPGSPLLLEHVQNRLRESLRDATPGEFTRRAFENGKLDLAAAEAVLDLIWAAGDEERRFALHVLDGGMCEATDRIRASVDDARALLEAGLDFTAGETGAVDPEQWLPGVRRAHTGLADLRRGIPESAPGGELLLVGAANAGKSSLCNALAGRHHVLVSDGAGTTRDVLAVEIAPGVTVLDAPGDLPTAEGADAEALALRDRLAPRAGGALLVVDLTAPVVSATALPIVAVVLTKSDLTRARGAGLALPVAPVFVVSSATGDGLPALQELLAERRRSGPVGARRRLANRLERAVAALERAMEVAVAGAPEELVAVDLAEAVAELDAVHGRSSPDDLLDRIFGSFCLGK